MALSVYETQLKEASTPLVGSRLRAVFEPHIAFTRIGATIYHGATALNNIADAYDGARRADRRVLIRTAVGFLNRLGDKAESGHVEQKNLAALGDKLAHFVLDGTVPQQVVCKLAIYLGLAGIAPPLELAKVLRHQFVPALKMVIEVGAPATADIAVEGLGALLKILRDDEKTVEDTLPTVAIHGNAEINSWYRKRMCRRYLLAASIAGDGESRTTLLRGLEESPDGDFDARSDLIRALPAVWRQSGSESKESIFAQCVRILCAATAVDVTESERLALKHTEARLRLAELHRLGVKESDEEAEITEGERRAIAREAFARYQEVVFTTISVMINRGADPEVFDTVVARAVSRLPATIAAGAAESNAETRSTIAIIGTAAKVVARTDSLRQLVDPRVPSKCEAQLVPHFEALPKTRSVWANPGIVEGCLRSLPVLLRRHVKDSWASHALEAILGMLREEGQPNELTILHRLVVANACFRALLRTLVGRMHEQLLEFGIAADEELYERNLDHAIAFLLAEPTADNLLAVFNPSYNPMAGRAREVPNALSEVVISAAVTGGELLKRIASIYAGWDSLAPPQRLLLTRILAAELRGATHEIREIARYPRLVKRFAVISGVSIENHKRLENLWNLLSSIPAQAADALDPDIQEFVDRSEHPAQWAPRDSTGIEKGRKAQYLADLPGYVLAMIDESISLRLARHIAREVNLNRMRARERDPNFDFASQLYQVSLRGPSVAIFDHLLPRIVDPVDSALLSLFRRHVANVHSESSHKVTIAELVENTYALLPDIERHQLTSGQRASPTLSALEDALRLYVKLAACDTSVWDAIRGEERAGQTDRERGEGGLHSLLLKLDAIASDTHLRHQEALDLVADAGERTNHPNFRQPLAPLCADECAQLRADVSHYVRLPVSQFEERHRAMRHALEATNRLKEKLREQLSLQPPEQVLLFVLLDHWRQLFDQTKEWYVDAPRRCIETARPQMFWDVFVMEEVNRTNEQEMDRRSAQWIVAEKSFLDRGIDEYMQQRYYSRSLGTPGDLGLTSDPPPQIEDQRVKFERFYVDWMSSELEIDQLYTALQERWADWLRRSYFCLTNLPLVLVFIVAPFILASVLHSVNSDLGHASEGLIFLFYVAVILVFALFLFLRRPLQAGRLRVRKVARRILRRGDDEPVDDLPPQYLFECILPSLFRLIIVPFVLLVEFEHSYTFSMDASDSVILLLMVLAFVTTRYFVRREVLGHDAEKPLVTHPNLLRRSEQARKIVAIALAQSFALALIFSLMFESRTIARHQREQRAADTISGSARKYHHSPYFLGVIPREAELDLGKLLYASGVPLSPKSRMRLDWIAYPTLILTWTALGLFFGVFLEGFMRGERLRGKVVG